MPQIGQDKKVYWKCARHGSYLVAFPKPRPQSHWEFVVLLENENQKVLCTKQKGMWENNSQSLAKWDPSRAFAQFGRFDANKDITMYK